MASVGGLRVAADVTMDALRPGDSAMLVLPGGMAWDEQKNESAAMRAAGGHIPG